MWPDMNDALRKYGFWDGWSSPSVRTIPSTHSKHRGGKRKPMSERRKRKQASARRAKLMGV